MGSVSSAERQADPGDKERAVQPTVLPLPPPPVSILPGSAPSERLSSPPRGEKKRENEGSDSQGERLHLFLAPCPAMSDNSLFIPWPLYDIEAYQQWQKYIE